MVTRETLLRDGLVRIGVDGPGDAAVERLLRLHGLLVEEALPRGFLGPEEADRIVERHLLESAALLPHLGPSGSLADVGSGAGLPGLVLACLRSGPVILIEAERRRAVFLRNAARQLDLEVEVVIERAEQAGRQPRLRDSCGVAVARALAPPPVALEYLLPLVAVGGRAVIAVGPRAKAESEGAARASEALAGGPPRLVRLEVPGMEAARWAMIVEKGDACPERYPRRVGVPARKPLGGT